MNTPDLEELERRIKAATDEVEAFHPDARMAVRSVFDAQERVFKMVPDIMEAIAKAREADELRSEVAANSAVAAKQVSDLAMQVGELRSALDAVYAKIDGFRFDSDADVFRLIDQIANIARAALGEAK